MYFICQMGSYSAQTGLVMRVALLTLAEIRLRCPLSVILGTGELSITASSHLAGTDLSLNYDVIPIRAASIDVVDLDNHTVRSVSRGRPSCAIEAGRDYRSG